MAKINNGHFGSFQGKIGAVTGVKRRGKFYIRQSITRNSSNTLLQQKVRKQFTHVSNIISAFAPILTVGFRNSTYPGATAYNVGFGFNFDKADKMTGALDPADVVVSRGSLINITTPTVTCPSAHTLKAVWTNNSTTSVGASPDDLVYMVVYEASDNLICSTFAKRADAELSINLPSTWVGRSVHSYFFTVSADGNKNSDSLYGNITAVE